MTSSEPERPRLSPEEVERRRHAAELLGELLPVRESDEGWNEKGRTSRDEEFLRDVPPHHG
jgi:hypothetical protein